MKSEILGDDAAPGARGAGTSLHTVLTVLTATAHLIREPSKG